MPIRRRGRTVPQAFKVIVSIVVVALATWITAAVLRGRANYEHPIGV